MATRNGRKATARSSIAIQGARVHNLKNISLELPRDKLIVVTGLSGSGKSSLAFDTIYAEGQRRYMESLSSYAKRFVAQVAKPDVDFVFGLSPVISIEQKTLVNNPRSTVGTMTDIASYLNLLFATIGQAHCPRTGEPTPSRSAAQIREAILSLPEGAEVELRAPVFKVYGEELDFVFTEIRKKGCRRLIVDGKPVDIAEQVELDASTVRDMDACVDRLIVGRKHEKAIRAAVAATLLIGDGLMQIDVLKGASKAEKTSSIRNCAARRITSSTAISHRNSSCSTIRRAPAAPAADSASTSSLTRSCSSPTPNAASSAVVSSGRRSGTTPTRGMDT
jgi:excinuclease ABC subunit A